MNNITVQKFGGSSLATPEKIKSVAAKIYKRICYGEKLVVVVSAMGKTTNSLISLSKEICSNPDPRELDMLLSTGEQVSVSLMTMALKEYGISAISLNSFQAGINTFGDYSSARIRDFDSGKLSEYVEKNQVVVITGFQGINEEGDITTLGRGGSDTSAVAIAAALNAKCEIYSDFAGIYTADPKIHPGAKKLKTISYDEMLEMSGLGAKVLHTRAVEIAKKFGIEIYCGATFSDEEGTTVTMNTIENPVVTGMSIQDDQTLVTVNNLKPDFNTVRNLFETIADNNHNVDMISVINNSGTINLSFSVIEDEREYVENIIKTFLNDMPESVLNYDHNNVKLSVVGIGMRDAKGVASRFFKALSNVPIKLVTTSEIKISCLFTKEYLNDAVKSITEEFGL